jgi:hypothetical protein
MIVRIDALIKPEIRNKHLLRRCRPDTHIDERGVIRSYIAPVHHHAAHLEGGRRHRLGP